MSKLEPGLWRCPTCRQTFSDPENPPSPPEGLSREATKAWTIHVRQRFPARSRGDHGVAHDPELAFRERAADIEDDERRAADRDRRSGGHWSDRFPW